MFWIICSIISAICIKFTLRRNDDNSLKIKDSTIANLIITGIFLAVAIVQFGIGIDAYPSLASELAEVQALENRLEDIRNSNYAYKKDGNFVAGSIENYQQSTNLTKYISELAAKEASYNKELKRVMVYKDVFPLYFFSTGWAISDRIEELPILGES